MRHTEDLYKNVGIQILEPVPFSCFYAQPRIKWYKLIDFPFESKTYLIIRAVDGKRVGEWDVSHLSEFIIPEPLEKGEYKVSVRAKLPDGRKIKSRSVSFFVDSSEASKRRITCPMPWSRLFIMGKNRVRPCCFLKEGVSLLANPLYPKADLWNNPGMVALREALLNGDSRFCHNHCPDLKYYEKAFWDDFADEPKAYQRGFLLVDAPKRLKISLGSSCNHRCVFCNTANEDYDHWKQSEAVIRYIESVINHIDVLTFTGGEPLLYIDRIEPGLLELIRNRENLSLRLQTNGSLINKHLDFLTSKHDLHLSVSVAAATRVTYSKIHRRDDFNEVCRGISQVKKSRKRKDTKIELKMVYMRSNYQEMLQYIDLAKKLDADEVYFHHLMILKGADIDPSEEIKTSDPEWQECLEIFEQCHALCNEHGIKLRVRVRNQKKVRQYNTKVLSHACEPF